MIREEYMIHGSSVSTLWEITDPVTDVWVVCRLTYKESMKNWFQGFGLTFHFTPEMSHPSCEGRKRMRKAMSSSRLWYSTSKVRVTDVSEPYQPYDPNIDM